MCEACIASAISTRFAELTVPLTFLPTSIDAQSSTAIRARAAAAQNRNVGVRALEQQEFIFRDYKPTIPPGSDLWHHQAYEGHSESPIGTGGIGKEVAAGGSSGSE